MQIASLSEIVITHVVGCMIRGDVKSAEEMRERVRVLPSVLRSRVYEVYGMNPEELGYWIVYTNVPSLAPLIYPRYVVSGAAKALLNGRTALADILIKKSPPKGARKPKPLTPSLRHYEYKGKIIQAAGRILNKTLALKYSSLIVNPGEPMRELWYQYLLGVARGGHTEAFKKLLPKGKWRHEDMLDASAHPEILILRDKVVASKNWPMFEILIKEFPHIDNAKLWNVAVTHGNARVLQHCIDRNLGHPGMDIDAIRTKTIRKGYHDIIEMTLTWYKEYTFETALSRDTLTMSLLRAVIADNQEIVIRLWPLYMRYAADDITRHRAFILYLVHIWKPSLLVSALASYHKIPIPSFQTSHDRDMWIAPLLGIFLDLTRRDYRCLYVGALDPLVFVSKGKYPMREILVQVKGPEFLDMACNLQLVSCHGNFSSIQHKESQIF